MDKKSKILLTLLIVLMVASIGYSFWETVIKQDFEIKTDIPLNE